MLPQIQGPHHDHPPEHPNKMVYFIQGEATKLIKIGKANDVVRRLRSLQSASPDRLTVLTIIPDALEDGPYHVKFAGSWSHGEWFQATPDLMDFIHLLPKSVYGGLFVRIRNSQAGTTAHPISDATWEGAREPHKGRETKAEKQADMKAALETTLKTPHEGGTIESLRSELAKNLLRDGEVELAHCIINGGGDEYVLKIMARSVLDEEDD